VRDSAYHTRRGKPRFDDEPSFVKRNRHRDALPSLDDIDSSDGLTTGDRWSTWDQSTPSERGPRPHPDWLVTDLAAADTELGLLKTGKEANVFLLERGVPGTERSCLLAAKRYRSADHRLFHRDSEYLEGRRVRESRDSRAMANRTSVGRQMIAVQWANTEFSALCQLHLAGVPVPYPVQVLGTELLMEFIGEPDGAAAPRLAETRRRGADLAGLWEQLVEAMCVLARLGLAHGDLSAYNLLVHSEQLVLIDTPQVVDVIANPRGGEYLDRDAGNVSKWFAARDLTGIGPDTPGPDELASVLRSEARLGPG
jgi:RIO kinase 1